jgi:crotonobetainyl-CoA:carnitine CoA-transferase CaiB-like acyl-CoA transferase
MDVTNGIMGACAAVTALVARQHSGQGDWIDLSESEAATHGLCGEQFLEFALHGSTTMPWGNRDLEHAPQGCYACQGEDEWMVLSIASDAEWQRFCAAVQHPEWATDPRFSTAADRRLHHDALDSLIEAWTQQHTPQEAMQILQQAGIAAGAVLDVGQLGEDPHLEHRRYFQTPLTGPSDRYPGFALQISGGGGVLKHRGADLGEHNHAVICDLLHYPESALKPILADEIGTSFDPE